MRSFSYLSGVTPLFLGNGRTINLETLDKVSGIFENLLDINAISNKDLIFFYLGEPNIRYQLGYGWTPRTSGKVVSPIIKHEYIHNIVDKYFVFFEKLSKTHPNIKLLTPTSGYPPSLPALKYFNTTLKEKRPNEVLDIFSHTLEKENSIKEEFKNIDYNYDPIHLNSNIRKIFIKEYKLNFDSEREFSILNPKFESLEIKRQFKYNPKFGCYTL